MNLLNKARAWNAARKQKAAERKAAKAHDPHIHSRFWLLQVPAIATICAAIVEWYWALLFCIEATGHIDWNYQTQFGSAEQTQALWNFAFSAHWPVLVGLVCATAPIVMLSMIWLPVQFAMRGAGRVRRGSIIAVGLLSNILVIVSGTVVMNYNRQEQVREAVVVEQTAAQGRAAIEARLAFEQEQLRLALSNSNPYLNQAANVGAEEWERSYVAQARASNDPRLPMLERALGAARAADQRRANIERLTVERATAAPEAASAANVQDNVGAELNTFAQYVEVWRPPFVAFICTLIGIFGAWWTLAMLERLNPRDVLRSGWADDAHRIEDKRDEPAVAPQPMKPPREEVFDAETGERLIEVRMKKDRYFRKAKPKKGERTSVELTPDIPPDETGVAHDGGGRSGSVVAVGETDGPSRAGQGFVGGEPDGEEAKQAHKDPDAHPSTAHDESAESGGANGPNGSGESGTGIQDDPPLTDEDLAAYEALAATQPVEQDAEPNDGADNQAQSQEPDQDGHVALPDGEGVVQITEDEPASREPETDPARLIAAE